VSHPEGDARPLRNVQKRRVSHSSDVPGELWSFLTDSNWQRMLLRLEENLTARFGEHGQDTIVRQKQIKLSKQLSPLLETLVVRAER